VRPDRRKFIKQTICAALGGASVYSALGQLQLVQAATRASSYAFSDYKALVCVFLYGGNDSFNTIVPYTQSAYNAYYGSNGVRPKLAIPRANLLALSNTPTSGDGIQYALHPSLTGLQTLFNSGHAAIAANVGTLIEPTNQAQAWAAMNNNGGVALPPQLFSHADQAAYWQSSPPTNQPITGWGGRIADLVASANGGNAPILTSLNGQDAFMRGVDVNGYIMGTTGASVIDLGYPSRQTPFAALHSGTQEANALERTFASAVNHSTSTAGVINTAVASHDFSAFFPGANYDLAAQLQTVAQLIYAANANQNNSGANYGGLRRQVFFVNAGGYDTHSDELNVHGDPVNPGILDLLSRSLAGFYNALASVGLANVATAFTASDFGRTLTNNDNGTDHGWGGHHFVVGGAVQGGKFYGNGSGFASNLASPNFGLVMPSLANPTTPYGILSPNLNDPGDGYGRLIPTTSVDQYAATLAHWFLSGGGVDPTGDIGLIFPNLANFSPSANYDPANGYLGFV